MSGTSNGVSSISGSATSQDQTLDPTHNFVFYSRSEQMLGAEKSGQSSNNFFRKEATLLYSTGINVVSLMHLFLEHGANYRRKRSARYEAER